MPDDVEALKRRLLASEAQRDLLELMVAKLKLQLATRNRTLYGTSSERLDAQGSLIEADRSLPAELPRETQEHRPATTDAHHDAAGQPCGCSACGGRLRRIGVDVSEQLEYVPATWASKPAPATPRLTGRAGAAAWKIVWHFTHASLGRTLQMTLKR